MALTCITTLPRQQSTEEAESATRIVLTFDCEITAAVGDVVYQKDGDDTFVLVNVNNTQVKASIGVIIEKGVGGITCDVLVLGIEDGFSGLSIGDKVWLSGSGTPTSTKPGTGYLQNLGTAVSATQIYFQPNTQRVNQSP